MTTKTNHYLKVLAALLVALAALTALTMAVAASTAEAAPKSKTTLTIKAQGTDLSGTVQSSNKDCLGERNVKLYKQKGKKQNPNADEYIGSDTSERQGNRGEWSTGNTGMSGKFYVRTAGTPECSAATSKTITARR